MTQPGAGPRVPPGQVLTKKWPVLTYGETPRVDLSTWSFRCFGLVEEDVSWSWEDFTTLPQTEVESDIHGGPCRLVVPRLYFWKSASDQETRAMQRMRAEAARRLRGR